MTITRMEWRNYIDRARKLNDRAAQLMTEFLQKYDTSTEQGMILALEYAYSLVTKYGEAASALSCEMYDAIAAASNAIIESAIPAATATKQEVAKQVIGTMKATNDPDSIAASVGRLVKLAGVDTTIQNALRDGAEWAWIPVGDTCPFCLMLASRDWSRASKNAIRKGHAAHIHSNCDCTYAVRFNRSTNVEGYDPAAINKMFGKADDETWTAAQWRAARNDIRRENYKVNKDKINEQQRIAYRARKENKQND